MTLNRRKFLSLLGATPVIASACRSRKTPTPPPPSNVVLILIDQLRKDAFDDLAPRMGSLARHGLYFDDMRSVAPWTYPSVVSLLSGLYPQQHGADGHATDRLLNRFSDKVPLIQHILKENGYETAGFVANPFLREWNPIHKGFDTYHSDFVKNVGNRRPTLSEFADPSKMFAPSVNQRIVEHFDAAPHKAPEFTYVHYIDVHGPWEGAPFKPRYDAAVNFIDGKVLDLYDYFVDRYNGDVLFCVTSDHGVALDDDPTVGFGSEWRISKKSVHDFNLKIPFVIFPGVNMKLTKKITEECSNVDFAPTILDMLGIKSSVPFSGRSLVPLMGGKTVDWSERALYAKNSAFGSKSDCVVYKDKKYMRFFDVGTDSLVAARSFDLVNDPRETTSIGSDFASVDEVMKRESGLHGLSYETDEQEVDEELEGQLRALGYIEGEEE